MTDTKAEIARVEKALATTTSPFLKRDYKKYLKKLERQLRAEKKVVLMNGQTPKRDR